MGTSGKIYEDERPGRYPRPTSRGDLVANLRGGVSCEVVAGNEETTRMLIDGWLNPPPYTVHPSKNEGWVIFRPYEGKVKK